MIQLRQYQVEAIHAARQKFIDGARRVILIAPTGSGKTVMFCDIIQRAIARGSRALVLAHRRELVGQASNKLSDIGVAHGVIQAGFRSALHWPVQVASVQTLVRRPGVISAIDIIVVDECHHITEGNTYAELMNWFPRARILGVTATPWRLDGAGLADVFDAHVLARTPRELRDEGFLVPVGGWEYASIDTRGARVNGGDFVGKSLEPAVMGKKLFGHIIQEWKAHAGNARTVLFACTVNHSMAMAHAFREAGVRAEHVDAKTPDAERSAILARLRDGRTRVLCNVNVVTEGFDLPELECCILARPTLSTSLYLQMVGRVLRPADGKAMARIHDHARCLAMHGHPYAERDYSPEKTARRPRGEAEGSPPSVRRCPECKSIVGNWPCEACGYTPTALEIEEELNAQRRAIGGDGAAPKKRAMADAYERRERWQRMTGEQKRQSYLRMVSKHGARKAAYVYWWASGYSEKPAYEWRIAG